MPTQTPTLPVSGNAAWDELTRWWLSRFKPSTQGTWVRLLPRWTSWCAEQGIDPMLATRVHVESWLALVADCGYARATLAAHYDVVASVYKLAAEEEMVARNPCARIRRPVVHRSMQRRESVSPLEYAAMLKASQEMGTDEHGVTVLAGMLALRASEIAGLTVESVFTARGYSTIRFIGKGDVAAIIPVPIPALAALDALTRDRETGPLVRTKAGSAMDRRAVYRYVVRVAEAAGIERPISPHALRRSAVTTALMIGVSLRETQRLARHARSDTTLQSYDRTGDALDRHASHQVAGFYAQFAN